MLKRLLLVGCILLLLYVTAMAQDWSRPTDLKGSVTCFFGLAGAVPAGDSSQALESPGFNGDLGVSYFVTDHLGIGVGMNMARNETAPYANTSVTSVRNSDPSVYIDYVGGNKDSKTRAFARVGFAWGDLAYFTGKTKAVSSASGPSYTAKVGVLYQIIGRLMVSGNVGVSDKPDNLSDWQIGAGVFLPIWKPFR